MFGGAPFGVSPFSTEEADVPVTASFADSSESKISAVVGVLTSVVGSISGAASIAAVGALAVASVQDPTRIESALGEDAFGTAPIAGSSEIIHPAPVIAAESSIRATSAGLGAAGKISGSSSETMTGGLGAAPKDSLESAMFIGVELLIPETILGDVVIKISSESSARGVGFLQPPDVRSFRDSSESSIAIGPEVLLGAIAGGGATKISGYSSERMVAGSQNSLLVAKLSGYSTERISTVLAPSGQISGYSTERMEGLQYSALQVRDSGVSTERIVARLGPYAEDSSESSGFIAPAVGASPKLSGYAGARMVKQPPIVIAQVEVFCLPLGFKVESRALPIGFKVKSLALPLV